jgi:pyruvate dehydrogenase E2 component (dihydrolipoamide acetyltransferase)
VSTDVLMPALSPTMEEGTLAKWHVKVGDAVKSGDVIAEIETDKATMEVEAVDEGTVEALLVPEGTEAVKVNAPIARLSGGDGRASPPQPTAAPPRRGEQEDSPPPSGGGGPRSGGGGATSEASPGGPPSRPSAVLPPEGGEKLSGAAAAKTPPSEPAPGPPEPGGSRIFASPLARRVAQQRGLDLSAIRGSGPHGRIILRDVQGAAPSARAAATGPAPSGSAEPAVGAEPPAKPRTLEQMGIPPGSYDLQPMDGMRRTVARRLTESFRDIPHFPLDVDIEIDALLEARSAINALLSARGAKVSVNDMVIKAAAVALMQVKDANASFTPEGIAYHHHADIAVAVAIDGGLITPIIRAAETKGVAQIADEMKDLAERARRRKLKPEEYLGGTFSISNLGMFGIRSFSSIINPPQGAILSVGVGERRPVVRDEAVAIATVMSVTLTCDHRVVDGAIGARWLAAFKGLIENPITMIA